jgi:hypothetical protein
MYIMYQCEVYSVNTINNRRKRKVTDRLEKDDSSNNIDN